MIWGLFAAVAALRALHPDTEVGVVARFEAQADLALTLGAHQVFAHEPVEALVEEAAAWSGGVLRGTHGLPMAYPGGIDVVYDTVSHRDTLEVSCRLLKARGTIVSGRGIGSQTPPIGDNTLPILDKDSRGRGTGSQTPPIGDDALPILWTGRAQPGAGLFSGRYRRGATAAATDDAARSAPA